MPMRMVLVRRQQVRQLHQEGPVVPPVRSARKLHPLQLPRNLELAHLLFQLRALERLECTRDLQGLDALASGLELGRVGAREVLQSNVALERLEPALPMTHGIGGRRVAIGATCASAAHGLRHERRRLELGLAQRPAVDRTRSIGTQP